jgi:hypothetical protein
VVVILVNIITIWRRRILLLLVVMLTQIMIIMISVHDYGNILHIPVYHVYRAVMVDVVFIYKFVDCVRTHKRDGR